MPKIFVLTAGAQAARRHLAYSIERPIPDETVFANFAQPHHGELEGVLYISHNRPNPHDRCRKMSRITKKPRT